VLFIFLLLVGRSGMLHVILQINFSFTDETKLGN